jgi:hypothetical protein
MGIQRVSEGIYLLEDAGAIVTPDLKALSHRDEEGRLAIVRVGKEDAEIWYWGRNNILPYEREELVMQNNIVPELISTKRGIVLGAGLGAYRERFEDGERIKEWVETPQEIQEWFDRVNINQYLRRAAKEVIFHGNLFTELIPGKARTMIADIQALRCRDTRAGRKRLNGQIPAYYWSEYWARHRNQKPDDLGRRIERIDAFTNLDEVPRRKAVHHTGDDLYDDGYYYSPAYWGGRQWIQLANCIPEFHIANLKHGYNIRYHIEIPEDYFYDHTAAQQAPNQQADLKQKAANARMDFLDRLNKFLAGAPNAGRAIVTNYDVNKQAGLGQFKEFPGIKITPLSVDLKDKALLELFEKSNQANISAQGIHPVLASIETAGKLSSGSEMRNAFLSYLAFKAPVIRNILLEPIHIIHRLNKWPRDIKWAFRDIELTKLDENPEGHTETNNA